MKRLCSYDLKKSEPQIVESIKHLSQQEQAEIIADKFSKVSQEYEPLKTKDIQFPPLDPETIPKFYQMMFSQILRKLKRDLNFTTSLFYR